MLTRYMNKETPSEAPPAITEEQIRALVDRSARGDKRAFGDLYGLYLTDVYRYFARHLNEPADAEDLAERTFLKVWRSLHRFRWRGKPFSAWLMTIAHNELVDFYRAQKQSAPLNEHTPALRDSPDEIVLRQIAYEKTRLALNDLTGEQKELIILKFFLEKDNKEIAAIMGKLEGTVRALQMRALAALKKRLSLDT